uniref:Leucine-rich repeat-containing N-terminal plant-type domain-containing protein n=1 Tax=Oryza barthii TaxID=65489 RepID=A0A0D3EQZ9_9ORYZ
MEFEWYDDSLFVVIKGRELLYSSQLKYMVSIDLSSNNLVGNIPEEVGSLIGLINLNLSFNQLTGNIPYQIGVLQSLESLDLSHNQLSGEIPQTLSNLTSLGELNLSYNNLSGRIPSGPQLDTLHTDDPASMIAFFRLFDNLYDRAYVFVVVSWALWFRKASASSST